MNLSRVLSEVGLAKATPVLKVQTLALLKGNPNANIPRTPEAALRRSTPVVNAETGDLQTPGFLPSTSDN